jgi:ADP-ribose pyrophosphatase YjhB (NUDIX family)
VEAAALRELREECSVDGRFIRRTSIYVDPFGGETVTFLVDIGEQSPRLGHDPELSAHEQILIDVRWLTLREIPERDRAFLWAAGLLGIECFLEEVAAWDDHPSYPGED